MRRGENQAVTRYHLRKRKDENTNTKNCIQTQYYHFFHDIASLCGAVCGPESYAQI